jgi:hypothetical protein
MLHGKHAASKALYCMATLYITDYTTAVELQHYSQFIYALTEQETKIRFHLLKGLLSNTQLGPNSVFSSHNTIEL